MNDKKGSLTNLTFRTISTETTLLTSADNADSSSVLNLKKDQNTTVSSNTNSNGASNGSTTSDSVRYWLDSSFDDSNTNLVSVNKSKCNDSNTASACLTKNEEAATSLLSPDRADLSEVKIEIEISTIKSKSSVNKCFSDIRCFTFFMCLIVMLTNALTVGYRNSVITTIEKRFEFSSVFSGVLSGSLEIGSLITTLFVSYFCAKSNMPKCIAISSLVCGLGSLLYALPHFLSGSYTVNNKVMNKTVEGLLCKIPGPKLFNGHNGINKTSFLELGLKTLADTNSEETHTKLKAHADNIIAFLNPFDLDPSCLLKPSNYGHFAILIIASLLIGSSSAPLYTLGTTYIDNHVSKDNSSIYLALVYSMLAFGPILGYLAGAGLLQYYVDGFSFNIKDLNISPGDSNWVGLWWAGFVIFGILIFLTGFPFFGFPKAIKNNRNQVKSEDVFAKEMSVEKTNENSFGSLKNLPQAIKNILLNKVFMIVTFAFCFEITIISGFMTFLPKYIEHQFSVNDSMANIYTGGIAIPGACFGIIIGGFIVKRFKIDPKGASIMASICNVFCLVGIVSLIFLGCPNIKMAGTTTPYSSNEKLTLNLKKVEIGEFNLTSSCNSNCHCSPTHIEPICGANGITYFSPCYAGCKQYKSRDSLTPLKDKGHIYSSCSCIIEDLYHNSTQKKEAYDNDKPVAQSGLCSFDCKTLGPFLIILFLITFLTTLNQMPLLMITLRSVTEIERAFALGLQLVIMRLLAYIPSPLIFGRAIEWTCLVWRRDECNQVGSCLFYDRERFRHIFGVIASIYKTISLILFVYLYFTVKKYSHKQKTIDMTTVVQTSSINSLNSANNKKENQIQIN